MKFLKENLGVTELDIEFYYDLKTKLIKMQENQKKHRIIKKIEDSEGFEEDQDAEIHIEEHRIEKETPKQEKVAIILDKKRSLPSIKLNSDRIEKDNNERTSQKSLNPKDKLPSIDRKTILNQIPLVSSIRLENQQPQSQRIAHNSTISSQFTSIPSAPRINRKTSIHKDPMYQNVQGNRSITEMTALTSMPIQEIENNKYYKRKPFSWLSQGDSFTMINPEKVFLTKAELSSQLSNTFRSKPGLNETGYKSSNSTMYSPKWEQTGFKEIDDSAFLQVREPYLLQSPAEFYRKVIPPRLPPPPPKPQVITVRRNTLVSVEKSEISKYILIPEGENKVSHRKTDQMWIAADFTEHQMSLYQPLLTAKGKDTLRSGSIEQEQVEKQINSDEDENQFRSIVVKKYIFDNSKKELEAIKKLVLHYEQRDTDLMAQAGSSKGDGQTILGYSRQQFDNENQMINLFLQTLSDSTSQDVQQISALKKIIEKRLALVNGILKNLDFDGQIKNYIKKREDQYLASLGQQLHEDSLAMVGTALPLGKPKNDSHIRQRRKLLKKKEKAKLRKKSSDSNMESESSSDESLEREVHYQKVLNRKVHIDKQRVLSLCIEFIRKEVKRVKHALQMNEYRRKMLPNPNRVCSTAMGFSENLMLLLKKNKEFLPQDIKMDLLRILPAGDLKELGSDLFIDDELASLAITKEIEDEKKRLKDLKKSKQKPEISIVPPTRAELTETMSKFNKMAEELNNDLTQILGENQEETTKEAVEQKDSTSNMNKLSGLNDRRLTDDQKSKLMSRGVIFRQGRAMMKDTQGNVVDIETVMQQAQDQLRKSPRSPRTEKSTHELQPQPSRLDNDGKSIGRPT